MLQSKQRTPEEIDAYLEELKTWLKEDRDTPAEEMTDFFSKRLGIYEDVHLGHWPEEYAHIADFFRDGLNSLLDIGCGTGLELNAVYRRFPQAEVTGIDLCRDMMDKLQQTYRDKHFKAIVADYFECPFEAERYDAALSFETLHHFPYEKKKRIYQKLYRALKPGGYYIECDYMACCAEEERLCLEQYEYKRKKRPARPRIRPSRHPLNPGAPGGAHTQRGISVCGRALSKQRHGDPAGGKKQKFMTRQKGGKREGKQMTERERCGRRALRLRRQRAAGQVAQSQKPGPRL